MDQLSEHKAIEEIQQETKKRRLEKFQREFEHAVLKEEEEEEHDT